MNEQNEKKTTLSDSFSDDLPELIPAEEEIISSDTIPGLIPIEEKTNFFDRLPSELILEILSFLSPKELTQTTNLVSHEWEQMSNHDWLWGESFQRNLVMIDPNNPNKDNKQTYWDNPQARKPGYIHYDQTGRNYLNGLIDDKLQDNQNLTPTQKAHLGSPLVRDQITTEKLTIESAKKQHHPFERLLIEMGIKHRYTRPYRPQTNGKVERFWRSLNEDLIEGTHFESVEHFKQELLDYMLYYNKLRPHQGINGKTPEEFAKNCQRIT